MEMTTPAMAHSRSSAFIHGSTSLPQLAEPDAYAACRWDLAAHDEQRAYWLGLFRNHFPSLLDHALKVAAHDGVDEGDARCRAEQAKREFFACLDELAAHPERVGRLDILTVCLEREKVLRRAGFDDPYRLAKQRENEAALRLLPRVLAELDAMEAGERDAALIHGVFAGNIFDLGAVATTAMFRDGTVDFEATRRKLKPRPWCVDDLDAWLERLGGEPYRAAVLFVDNAGPDITLGMIPLARELVRRGTKVILAANTDPSLNDITHAELVGLLERVAAFDRPIREAMAAGRLTALADGNGAPLIDLGKLAPAFVEAVAAEPVDLVVLEGMGRAIESNYDARFACDCLKLAMIKDEGVARAMGAELYDLVLRFEPAA